MASATDTSKARFQVHFQTSYDLRIRRHRDGLGEFHVQDAHRHVRVA